LCLKTLTQWVEIVLIWSKSAQNAEWGTVTELKKQMLIGIVVKKIEYFYNLIGKIVLIKILKSINKKKRELAGNIDLTAVKRKGGEKKSIKGLFQEPT